jgi:hypothetical protein
MVWALYVCLLFIEAPDTLCPFRLKLPACCGGKALESRILILR